MSGTEQERGAWLFEVLGLRVTPVDPAYAARRDALEPRLHEALRADPEQRGGLTAVWAAAQEYAEAGDVSRAQATLDRLSTSVDGVLAQGQEGRAERMGIASGLVAQRRAKLEAEMREHAAASRALTAADLGSLAPGLDEMIERPQALLAAMEAYVSGTFDRIIMALEEASAQPDATAAGRRILAMQSEISADAKLAAIGEAVAAFDLDDPRETIATMFGEWLAHLAEIPAGETAA